MQSPNYNTSLFHNNLKLNETVGSYIINYSIYAILNFILSYIIYKVKINESKHIFIFKNMIIECIRWTISKNMDY